MKTLVKYGLIVGAVALVVIVPVSAFMGICGPGITLVAGAVAGFLAAYRGSTATRSEGAQAGAIAGAVAGGVTLMGQMIGGLLVLSFIHLTGMPIAFGHAPGADSPMYEVITYYVSGLGAGLCFGLIGLILAAMAGAGAGAFGARQAPTAPLTPIQPQ